MAETLGSGVAGLAEPRTPAGTSLQWEFTLVTFQDSRGWRPRFENGHELKDWMSGPVIHEYLQAKGAQGWDLAAASAGERLYGSGDNHQLYFKRLAIDGNGR